MVFIELDFESVSGNSFTFLTNSFVVKDNLLLLGDEFLFYSFEDDRFFSIYDFPSHFYICSFSFTGKYLFINDAEIESFSCKSFSQLLEDLKNGYC